MHRDEVILRRSFAGDSDEHPIHRHPIPQRDKFIAGHGGHGQFVGLEGVPPLLTRAQEIRRSYQTEIEAFRTRLREGCERNQCHYVLVNTRDALRDTLSGYLAFRRKTGRSRRGAA